MLGVQRALASAGILALLSVSAAAQDAAPPLWLDTQTANCRVQILEPVATSSITWSGACADGTAAGEGTLVWIYRDYEGAERSSSYTGTMRGGLPHGRGVIELASGDRYEGDWADGVKSGRGIMAWANGDRYDGDWKDDTQSGHGIYVWANGDRYAGDWANDEQSGRGTYVFANGFTYVGDWARGSRNGQGRITWPDGKYYDGPFIDDLAHGIGECKGADGTVGKCEFVNGEFSRWQ